MLYYISFHDPTSALAYAYLPARLQPELVPENFKRRIPRCVRCLGGGGTLLAPRCHARAVWAVSARW